MNLTTDLLSQIVRDLRSDKLTGGKRREQPRVGLRCRATVVPCTRGDFVPRPVWVRDLSISGIGFRFPEVMVRGQQFVLFVSKPRGGIVRVLCRVQHAERCPGDAGYSVGARLLAVLPTDGTLKQGPVQPLLLVNPPAGFAASSTGQVATPAA